MTRQPGTGVLIVWVDLDPDIEQEADRWYIAEHLPERVSEAGYLRACRYRAVSGTPAYMSVFEATTPDALASEGYRRITATISPLSARIRAGFRRCIRSTHCVKVSTGGAAGGSIVCARIDFADAQSRAAFLEWAQRGAAEWVRARDEVLAAHVLEPARQIRERMDSFRATGQHDEWADTVLLLECARLEEAERVALELQTQLLQAQGLAFRACSVSIYQPMVEFSRASRN